MLKFKDTASVIIGANKDAAIDSSKLIAGNIINDRLNKILVPKLPIVARGYAQTNLGRAALSNLIAGLLIHTMPDNAKVQVAAEAMIASASLQLASSFNIEEMINELLDGVPGLDTAEERTAE